MRVCPDFLSGDAYHPAAHELAPAGIPEEPCAWRLALGPIGGNSVEMVMPSPVRDSVVPRAPRPGGQRVREPLGPPLPMVVGTAQRCRAIMHLVVTGQVTIREEQRSHPAREPPPGLAAASLCVTYLPFPGRPRSSIHTALGSLPVATLRDTVSPTPGAPASQPVRWCLPLMGLQR